MWYYSKVRFKTILLRDKKITMKKCLSIIAVLMLSVCFLLSGCSPKLEMPTGQIQSNGGRVVMVGDYVYHANTFVDYTTLEGNANTKDTTEQNAIIRFKTDNYGYVNYNDEHVMQDSEEVCKKIAGYNNSNMFVIGEYLYFTSPNAHKTSDGKDMFNLSTLFKVKLDGTEQEEIFSTSTTQGKFFLVTEQNPYLLVFDNNQIIKLNLDGKHKVLADGVLDTIFPKEYGVISTVYYTKDISTMDKNIGLSGNLLYKLDLATGTSTKLGKPQSHTITFVAYQNNILYYKKLVDGEALYYSNTFNGGFEAGEQLLTAVGEVAGSDGSVTDSISYFMPINEENYVYVYNTKIHLNKSSTPLVNEAATIEMVYGDYVYYTTSNGIYRISYKDKQVQTVATITNIQPGSLEVAGEYLYFYAYAENNVTNTYYAYRANNRIIENGRQKVEVVGQVLIEDIEGLSEDVVVE